MRHWCIPLLLALSLLTGACAERKRRASVHAKELIAKYVGTQATTPQHKLSFRFGDKVELVGFDLSPEPITTGVPFTVTWHWKVEKPLGESWRQFTHVVDARGVSRINQDDNRKLFGAYTCGEWKAGQYVRDVQVITLPEDWTSNGVKLMLGFWRDGERMPVTKGEHQEDRVLGFARPVKRAGEQPKPTPPHLVANPRTADVKLDGKLDEPDWAKAASTGPFVNTMRGTAGAFGVKARMLFDDEALYVAFEVEDDFLKAEYDKPDSHLWEQDTVEVMVDPDGDGKNYFEMQVSPRNVTFDTRYDSRRQPRPFGDVAWNAGTKAGVALRGKLDDDEPDEGYTVEMRVPWTAFAHGTPKAEPPKPGDTWRVNLFVMDARDKGVRAVGWSPPLVGDFHTLDRFGSVRFGTPVPAEPDKPEGDKPEGDKPESDKPKGGKTAATKPLTPAPAAPKNPVDTKTP